MAKKSSRILSLILALVLIASWAVSASALSVSTKRSNSAVISVCTCGDRLFLAKKSTVTIKNNGDQAITVKCISSNAKDVEGNIWGGVKIYPGGQMSIQITTSWGKSAVTKLKVTSFDPDSIDFTVTGKKTGAIGWTA